MMAKEAMSIKDVRARYEALASEFNSSACNEKACEDHLRKLKVALVQLNFLKLVPGDPSFMDVTLLARNILEIGAQLSIRKKDITAFERYMSQLRVYYYDLRDDLPTSEKMYTLLGLNLLRLLMNNQIAEFHTELELMGPERLDNPYIQYPIKIEQYLTVGSYNKVWKSWKEVPVKEYLLFMETFSCTIRNEIAECIQKAYNTLPIADAVVLMHLNNPEDIQYFIKKYNWNIDEATGTIHFKAPLPEPELPIAEKLGTFLDYALELDKIV